MSPLDLNALVRFREARTLTPSKRTAAESIRQFITEALDDDEFFDKISPYLIPEGVAGNRQMDHGLVAQMFFEHPAVGVRLKAYKNLTHKGLWDHIAFVLQKYGYKFAGGRVIGYEVLEDKTENAEAA